MNRITDEDMKKCLLSINIQNLSETLGAEVTYSFTLDHTGKKTKKITFEYPDDDE